MDDKQEILSVMVDNKSDINDESKNSSSSHTQTESDGYCIIYTTIEASNFKLKDELIRVLLENKLAACIQASNIQSSYVWDGQIVCDDEIRLAIKTKKSKFNAIKQIICELHNYEIPQIICVDISDGFDGYLDWIDGIEVIKKYFRYSCD